MEKQSGLFQLLLKAVKDRNTHDMFKASKNYVKFNRWQAGKDAQNPIFMKDNPLLCAQLCNSLSKEMINETDKAFWLSRVAYNYAAAGDRRVSMGCARNFIQLDREQAKQDAQDPSIMKDNPLYCAQLCNKLAEKENVESDCAFWYGRAGYNYALANEFSAMVACLAKYVKNN